MKYLASVFVLYIVALAGCKADQGVPIPDYTAEITFLKPSDGQLFNSEDQVNVQIDVDNNDIVHNVSVYVINESSNDTVSSFSEHVHEESGHYEYRQVVTVSATALTDWKIVAKSWDMHAGVSESDKISAQLNFQVQP